MPPTFNPGVFFFKGDLRVSSLSFSLYKDTKKIEQEKGHVHFPKGALHFFPGDDANLFYLVEPRSATPAGWGGETRETLKAWALLVEWASSFRNSQMVPHHS